MACGERRRANTREPSDGAWRRARRPRRREAPMSDDRLIATIKKNSREEIRVTRGDFKGHDIVGLRVWFEDRASGEMRPGKDGLAFRAEFVDEIIEALRAAKGGAP